MRMLFRIFIHTLKLCRSHYYSEFEKVSFMLSSKAWVACEVARRIFIETARSSVSMCSFILEENVIACEEYGHLRLFLVARKESLVVRSKERQLYSQSRKVK